jgi:hypothetical protein
MSDPREHRTMSGAIWRDLVERLRELESLVTGDDVPASPQDRAEGFRYLLRFLACGIRVAVPGGNPDYPEFSRVIENGLSWGLDNPDCNYSWARVRGDAVYRVAGNRGSARHLEFQVNTGHLGDGNVGRWRTVSALNARQLVTAPDGSFELYVGGERRDGNWMALDAEASYLFLRQYFEDWERERPAEIFIERVGAEYPQPVVTTSAVAATFDELAMWMSTGARSWEAMSRLIVGTAANQVAMTPPMEGSAGLLGQSYGLGHFACAPDEAVVVEFEVPECLLWSVQLSGWYWESMEFAGRQTSLNSSQAVVDGDGRFRGVIAHDDPGVHNWIDPEGHADGTIGIRYLFPDRVTQPVLTRVPVADLVRVLPPDTRRVTPDERRQALERRRRAVQLRYRY